MAAKLIHSKYGKYSMPIFLLHLIKVGILTHHAYNTKVRIMPVLIKYCILYLSNVAMLLAYFPKLSSQKACPIAS